MARSTIDKRENGRYRARYVGPDRKWHSNTEDRRVDAQDWLSQELNSVGDGNWIPPKMRRREVGSMAERWWATTVNLKPKTREGYESLLRVYVLPEFGSWRIGDVNRAKVREWLARLQAQGLSASRTRQARSVLSSVLELAIESGAISANPARGVKVSGTTSREMLHLDARQVSRLATEAEHQSAGAGVLVLVLAYGGIRWGEVAALRRGRCDLLRSRLLIRESVSEVGGVLHYGPTKTHQARTIVLPGFLRDRLAAHIASLSDPSSDALVFSDRIGGVLRNSNWRIRVWKPACESAGMPDGLRIHDLRHTAASLLVSAGANVKAVQRHLGHSSASMTLDRYSHLFTEDLEALADRLDVVFFRTKRVPSASCGLETVVDLAAAR